MPQANAGQVAGLTCRRKSCQMPPSMRAEPCQYVRDPRSGLAQRKPNFESPLCQAANPLASLFAAAATDSPAAVVGWPAKGHRARHQSNHHSIASYLSLMSLLWWRDEDQAPEGVEPVIARLAFEARADRRRSLSDGRRNRNAHLALGALAALAAAGAGISALAEWSPAVSAVAGFTAAALTGHAVLNQTAQFHFWQAAQYGDVALKAEALQERGSYESEAFDQLVERLKTIRATRDIQFSGLSTSSSDGGAQPS